MQNTNYCVTMPWRGWWYRSRGWHRCGRSAARGLRRTCRLQEMPSVRRPAAVAALDCLQRCVELCRIPKVETPGPFAQPVWFRWVFRRHHCKLFRANCDTFLCSVVRLSVVCLYASHFLAPCLTLWQIQMAFSRYVTFVRFKDTFRWIGSPDPRKKYIWGQLPVKTHNCDTVMPPLGKLRRSFFVLCSVVKA